jgi:CheY-like chemotaxis protein
MSEATVLIIDDSAELRALLESILPYSGYQTISASSGEQGINLALQHKPDVILVDLELPDTSGIQVLEELNRHQLTAPTIMITGFGSEGVAARALHLGALGYLIKPFTTEEVLASVERALTVRELRREKAQLTTLLDTYAHHLRTISALSHALVTGLPPRQLYQRIVEAGAFVTRSERCLLLLPSPTPNRLRIWAAAGESSFSTRDLDAHRGDLRLRPVLQRGLAVHLQATPGSSILLQTGDTVQSVLQMPLKAQNQIIGFLSADRKQTARPFGKHDEWMLSILADFVTIAWAADHHLENSTHPTSQP